MSRPGVDGDHDLATASVKTSLAHSAAHAALGHAVEQVIAKRGMSQSTFAQKAGIDIRRISAILLGQANPTYGACSGSATRSRSRPAS